MSGALATPLPVERALRALDGISTLRIRGRVSELTGLVIRGRVPGVRVGEVVMLEAQGRAPVRTEVVGFRGDDVMLMPLGAPAGIGPDSELRPTGEPLAIRVGPELRGRVLDGLGAPMDGQPLPAGLRRWSVHRECPDPFRRKRVDQALPLGVKVIDGLLTVGRGQRVGLFAGSGVGKSTLMGQIARGSRAEINVIALIGERGRELGEFLEEALGVEGLRRSVVVCATSDQPALVRLNAAHVATSIAEYFREEGADVMFMLDSITRLARAQREVGLAIGEPPARQGYPPSVFSMLPRLLERTGNSERGTCTAIYTCLVAGDDMDEPIADEVRGILDGHFVLSRTHAERNHWPAIDVLASLSRVMNGVVGPEHRTAAERFRRVLATYEKNRDLILLGAYPYGSDPATDEAIDCHEAMVEFARQDSRGSVPFEQMLESLKGLFP
jgi:type III secretion protein N (ATPase)